MEIADWEKRVPILGNEMDQVFTTAIARGREEMNFEYRTRNFEFRRERHFRCPSSNPWNLFFCAFLRLTHCANFLFYEPRFEQVVFAWRQGLDALFLTRELSSWAGGHPGFHLLTESVAGRGVIAQFAKGRVEPKKGQAKCV